MQGRLRYVQGFVQCGSEHGALNPESSLLSLTVMEFFVPRIVLQVHAFGPEPQLSSSSGETDRVATKELKSQQSQYTASQFQLLNPKP